MASQIVFVNEFTNGILDPKDSMLGPVQNGGYIIANTAPGCWGPMITPAIRGGHEVTKPVYVEGAKVGDSIIIRIHSIKVTSIITSSGNERVIDGRFLGDPFVAGRCPKCGTLYPETIIDGIGKDAIKCKICNESVAPFEFTNGYTIVFDENYKMGITLNKSMAENVAKNAKKYMKIPDNSIQNPIAIFAQADIVGLTARLRPFMGQLGTLPGIVMPDSHNAGDFGQFLIDAPHEYAIRKEQLSLRTDGHMDVNKVREGAIVIAPVKVDGAGVYLGDMHAMQGDGEIAGHTTDVAGIVIVQVEVLKNLELEGPIILPNAEDLPYLARPFSCEEKEIAKKLADIWEVTEVEESLPVSFVGSGANINDATNNALQRASKLLGISIPEVKNRATITGAIEIGRLPGTVTATFLVPVNLLKKVNLYDIVAKKYKI
ncbi:Acetamidase/Formamidase [Thermodesulfobium narugense DSM 14796]|uniref:Acetamidase/Formamidase n=1 Tax=Thermodesulfobium narugense DSM 14796 TaxID=747365 RepID=M1E5U2_9BACT|nr:acetamidase/formamidase family protein [Thermodesulfobium narugense]AEE14491.1 Acetamidase/Formamidase [Thermodesulfobium narugense DSM 14796]